MKSWLILLPLFLFGSLATAGVKDGNSGGFGGSDDTVWFTGDQTVEYCITRLNRYPLTDDELSELVRASLAQWLSFFSKYGLSDEIQYSDGARRVKVRMAAHFTESQECSSPSHQLEFVFGDLNSFRGLSQTAGVKHLRRNPALLENLFGAAVPYQHSVATTPRRGGVVWVDAFSTNANTIQHLLLHEIGHVFGMRHDSVFVMKRNVVQYLIDAPNLFGGRGAKEFVHRDLGKIESSLWPFSVANRRQPIELSAGGTCAWGQTFNEVLPKLLASDGLGLSAVESTSGCHTLLLSTAMAGMDSLHSEITIKANNGKQVKMSGVFKLIPGEIFGFAQGPSTALQYDPKIFHNFKRMFFAVDPKWGLTVNKSISGFFEWSGVRFPAVLDTSRGMSLRLHDPETSRWSVWQDEVLAKLALVE